MVNSFFLFIMLLSFKHTHLISVLDVIPCIPLHLLSSCTFATYESENQTTLYFCCSIMFILVVGVDWNKHQEDE